MKWLCRVVVRAEVVELAGSVVRSSRAARVAKDRAVARAVASGHGRRTFRSAAGESVVAAAAVVVVAVLRIRLFWMDL